MLPAILPSQRLKRFTREPHKLPNREINATSLDILKLLLSYRFLPTSLILALIPGNQRILYKHLQTLFHQGLINRFPFPLRTSEFVYYLDSKDVLNLLIDRLAIQPAPGDVEEHQEVIRNNRENRYCELHRRTDSHGRGTFLNHELGISRFHAALELGCRQFPGKIELALWVQGAPLFNRVEVPKAIKDPHDYNRFMESRTETMKLPHRPDALFILRFPTKPEGKQLAPFLYERDRKTESLTAYRLKLRAHYHFAANIENRPKPLLQLYTPKYGIQHIRAVLTETEDEHWCKHLTNGASHPIVSPKPSPLFWFTHTSRFAAPTSTTHNGTHKPLPAFLSTPRLIFERMWQTPADATPLSLLD